MSSGENVDADEMTALEDAIDKSKRWMEQAHSLIDGRSFPTSDRNRVAVSLFHLCIEHHQGIHTLVDHGVIGSAFALVRPQLEAYVRGAWFAVCATDVDVARFLRDEGPPRIGILIENLEEKEAYKSGSLRRMKAELWDTLCGLTHGGYIQVLARNREDEIVQRYLLPHITGLIKASPILSYLACVGMAAVLDEQPLAAKMREAHQAIYGTKVAGDLISG
jgi:hypothetical protein